MAFKIHNYEPYAPGELPQDDSMDGSGWTFETLEHGGPNTDEIAFPEAILARDDQGREHIYMACFVDGAPVRSINYNFNPDRDARAEPPPRRRRWATLCVNCGPNVPIDEDECCTACGATANGEWLDKEWINGS